MVHRRDVVTRTALALGVGVLPLGAGLLHPRAARAQAPLDTAALMQPGPLGDVWEGPADAKVTIIEYASMTCSHCAHFHKTTYPVLKERYIDAGKVRFTLREFPLDPRATAAFMLARCDGAAKYYPVTDLLFDQQEAWAFVRPPQSPVDALEQILKQAGFTKERVEACIKDQKVYNAINAVKTRGLDVLKVESTPTFFINGQKFSGAMSIEEMEKVIKPMLGA